MRFAPGLVTLSGLSLFSGNAYLILKLPGFRDFCLTRHAIIR